MKKKFLLALVVVSALICIFAISASAATMTSIDGETLTITEYDDAPSKTNITVSIYDLVVFDDGFVCPSAYIFKDNAINYGDSDGDARIQYCLDFTYINGKRAAETGNEDFAYTYKNIVEFDLPEGVTHFTKRAFQNVTTIRKVTIPKTVKTISVATFQNASGLEEFVFEHGERDDLKTIPGYMFYGCKKLKAVSLPDCATKIADAATFASCSTLGAVYLPKNLTTIVSGGGGSRNATFDDCYAVYFVNTPFTTSDTAPAKPTIYYFPENLESISDNSVMRECRALNDVLVFGEKMTTMPNMYFFQNGPANKIVFLGDMTNVSTQYWGKTTQIFFANPQDKSTDDVTYSGGRTVVFCHAEGNTTHLLEKTKTTDATCTENSKTTSLCFCGAEMGALENENTALGHDDKDATVIMYFVNNDYFKNATSEYTCKRCEEAIKSEIENSALFTKKGITVPENEKTTSICHAITVNNKAIDAYNAYLGESNAIKYGVVVGKATASGTPVNADGTASGNAIIVGFDGTAYSHIQSKITNVPDNTGLYCSAYVIDAGVVTYLYEGSVASTATVISLNNYNPTLPEATVPSNDEE